MNSCIPQGYLRHNQQLPAEENIPGRESTTWYSVPNDSALAPPRAMKAALSEPSFEWQEHTAPSGMMYYFNKKTRISSWEKPDELMSPLERADASTEWKEFCTPDGQRFYVNKVTKTSKWLIPDELKVARELAMKESNEQTQHTGKTAAAVATIASNSHVFELGRNSMESLSVTRSHDRKDILSTEDFVFPKYLSFVRVLIDSSDSLIDTPGQSRILGIMRKRLAQMVLDMIEEIAEKDDDDYKIFWGSFGNFVKIGCIEDANRKQLAPLLRFLSSKTEGSMISLDQYIGNMPKNQEAIYYTTNNHHNTRLLEKLIQNDIEVLYLVDPLEEYVVQNLQTYRGKSFLDISNEDLELGQEHTLLCNWVKEQLDDKVAKVQINKCLNSSPCVLVSGMIGLSADMQRLMSVHTLDETSNQFMRATRTLQINPEHHIIRSLDAARKNDLGTKKRGGSLSSCMRLLLCVVVILTVQPESPAELGNKIYEMLDSAPGGMRDGGCLD